jgi:hypothetical protein
VTGSFIERIPMSVSVNAASSSSNRVQVPDTT